MKSAAAEIARISELLPAAKAARLLQYARSLVASSEVGGESEGHMSWERVLSKPNSRRKLSAKIKEVGELIAEGQSEPMDFQRL